MKYISITPEIRQTAHLINSKTFYIRELLIFKTKISVHPMAWSASIFSDTSFFKTREETALIVPHSRVVIVGDFFPGVTLMASGNKSMAALYMTITYLVAVIYPSMRLFSNATISLCVELGLEIKTASVDKISWTTSRPAALNKTKHKF
jgi:hypothetical protein